MPRNTRTWPSALSLPSTLPSFVPTRGPLACADVAKRSTNNSAANKWRGRMCIKLALPQGKYNQVERFHDFRPCPCQRRDNDGISQPLQGGYLNVSDHSA